LFPFSAFFPSLLANPGHIVEGGFIYQAVYLISYHIISYPDLKRNMTAISEEAIVMRRVSIILLVLILMLLALAVAAAAGSKDRIQSVGGEFGRNWLEGNLAIKSNKTAPDNRSNLSRADPFSEDWLGITSILKASNTTEKKPQVSSKQELPYSFSRMITPVHQIDASWNQSNMVMALPEPDKSGLINGIPAEIYYAIGPAYYNF